MTQQFTPRYLPKRNKTYVHTKTHTLMFTEVLFVIDKTCKQLKCQLAN